MRHFVTCSLTKGLAGFACRARAPAAAASRASRSVHGSARRQHNHEYIALQTQHIAQAVEACRPMRRYASGAGSLVAPAAEGGSRVYSCTALSALLYTT